MAKITGCFGSSQSLSMWPNSSNSRAASPVPPRYSLRPGRSMILVLPVVRLTTMTRKKSLIIAFPSVFGFAWQFHHLQTVVRAELHALSAVNAHIRVDLMVEENGVYGTCFGTFAAADAELRFWMTPPSLRCRSEPVGMPRRRGPGDTRDRPALQIRWKGRRTRICGCPPCSMTKICGPAWSRPANTNDSRYTVPFVQP